MNKITCIRCGLPPAFPEVASEPYICLACQNYAGQSELIKARYEAEIEGYKKGFKAGQESVMKLIQQRTHVTPGLNLH